MFKMPKIFRFSLPLSAVVLAATGLTSVAQAQGTGAQANEAIEEIVTTGTRRSQRSASDSSVPVDVISGDEFENMGTADLNDMLRTAIPSYNVGRHSISDAATLVRPATMRGLPPDNVLILVNGKRRHRSGVIAELGGDLAEGSQGADISAIPALAIKQTEVLRDGASAQYGSDAIAGVINFVLKDDSSGMTFEARTGEFMEGDGQMVQLAGNIGLPLGDNGFFNLTGSWMEKDASSRSTQRTDAATLLASGNLEQQQTVRQPYAQIYGGPEYRDNWNLFFNSAVQISDSQEIYAFGNFGRRETEGGFFFRNPNDRTGVYDDGTLGVRSIVDTTMQGGESGFTSNCPALVSPGSGGDGVLLDPQAVQDDAIALANLPANCWVMNQVVPGGYTPQFGGELKDASIVGGFRGETEGGLLYDFSGSYGRNKVSFFLNNTWNPSNGPDGIIEGELQRDFDIGSYVQSETNINLDYVLPIAVDAFASDLTFAFGGEYRDEVFETLIGEEASWNAGRFAFMNNDGTNTYSDGVTPLSSLSIGAHGFAGFSPQQAGLWDRSNIAVYGELEADMTENFTLGVAVRYEDFESFGDTTNWKVAARWALTDAFALRGSYSTGFRAPTPGQENVTKVSTVTVDGELQQRGQIPPGNPIAQFLGAEDLIPEDSTNASVGVVWDITDNFNLTADYYQINVENRISQTGTIDISGLPAPPQANCPNAQANPNGNLALCLQELGVPGAGDLAAVSFYTNDFETTANGIDLVATWNTDWGNAGNGTLVAAWNWTETTVDNAGSEVDRNKVVNLENFNPLNRGVFTYNHFIGNFRFLARARYYDDWVDADWSDDPTVPGPNGTGYTLDCAYPQDLCYSGTTLFDLEAAYTFAEKYSIIVGAMNVADENGPLDGENVGSGTIGSGNTYTDSTPYGYEGGMYYVRFRAEFD